MSESLKNIVYPKHKQRGRSNPANDPSDPLAKATSQILALMDQDMENEASFLNLYQGTFGTPSLNIYEALLGVNSDIVSLSQVRNMTNATMSSSTHAANVVYAMLERLPPVYRNNYSPATRFLIYYLLASGFFKEDGLFDAFASFKPTEVTQSLPIGTILNQLSMTLAFILKDACVCISVGLTGTAKSLERNIISYWDDVIESITASGQDFNPSKTQAFESKMTDAIQSAVGRTSKPSDIFDSVLRIHPHHIAGLISSISYFFYLKKYNDNIMDSEGSFLGDVIKKDDSRFVKENRVLDRKQKDPREYFEFVGEGDPDEVLEIQVTYKDKFGVVQPVPGKTKRISRYDQAKSDAIDSYNEETSQRTRDFFRGLDRFAPPTADDLKAQIEQFKKNGFRLCMFSIRFLLGMSLYAKHTSGAPWQYSANVPSVSSMKITEMSHASGSSVTADIQFLEGVANNKLMLTPDACVLPSKPRMEGLETTYTPITEIYEIYTKGVLLFDYDPRYTLVSPFVLMLEVKNIHFAFDDLSANETVAKVEDFFLPTAGVKYLEAHIGYEWFKAYATISLISSTLNKDLFALDDAYPRPLDDEEKGIPLLVEAYNIQLKEVNNILRRFATKKKFIFDWKQNGQSLEKLYADELSNLHSLTLSFSESAISTQDCIDIFLEDWGSTLKRLKSTGFRNFFNNTYIPLFRSVGSTYLSSIAPKPVWQGINHIDVCSKFLSFVKVLYGEKVIRELDGILKGLWGQDAVAQKLYECLLDGNAVDYTTVLDYIKDPNNPLDIVTVRNVLASAMVKKALERAPLVDVFVGGRADRLNPREGSLVTQFYRKNNVVSLFTPEKDGSILYFEHFVDLIENLEYVVSRLDKSNLTQVRVFEAGPYLIAGLLEIGFASKDEFILSLDNYMGAPTNDNLSNEQAKQSLVIQLFEGNSCFDLNAPSKGASIDIGKGVGEEDLQIGFRDYLSRGIMDFVSSATELMLTSIKRALNQTNQGVANSLMSRIDNQKQANTDLPLLFRLFHDSFSGSRNVNINSALVGVTTYETFNINYRNDMKAAKRFGHPQTPSVNVLDITSANGFAKDTILEATICYIISRQKGNYATFGLDVSANSPLMVACENVGSAVMNEYDIIDENGTKANIRTIQKDDVTNPSKKSPLKSVKHILHNYLTCAGNPLVTFTGQALVSSCCMTPNNHGTTSVFCAMLSDKSMAYQFVESVEISHGADGTLSKSVVKAFTTSSYIHTPSFLDESLCRFGIAANIVGDTKDWRKDVVGKPKVRRAAITAYSKVSTYMDQQGLESYIILDSVEASQEFKNTIGGSGCGYTTTEYSTAFLFTYASKFVFVIVGPVNSSSDLASAVRKTAKFDAQVLDNDLSDYTINHFALETKKAGKCAISGKGKNIFENAMMTNIGFLPCMSLETLSSKGFTSSRQVFVTDLQDALRCYDDIQMFLNVGISTTKIARSRKFLVDFQFCTYGFDANEGLDMRALMVSGYHDKFEPSGIVPVANNHYSDEGNDRYLESEDEDSIDSYTISLALLLHLYEVVGEEATTKSLDRFSLDTIVVSDSDLSNKNAIVKK